MIKRIKKASALILTTVILFAVSTIAAGINMYFYRAALLTRNTNVYFQKHIELENEFNKNFLVVLNTELEDGHNVRTFFANNAESSMAFLDGEYYSTIKREYDGDKHIFTYEIETTLNRRDCHLIKTVYKKDGVFTIDPQEVYYVKIIN